MSKQALVFVMGLAALLAWGVYHAVWRPVPTAAMDFLEVGYAPDLYPLPQEDIDKGFFKAHGLNVKFRSYPTGSKALEGLLAGETDVAMVGLGPLVQTSFHKPDLRIIATLATHYDLYRIVARRDLGIVQAEDLRGRRVGVTRGSSMHYFLENYLLEHGLAAQRELELVFVDEVSMLPTLLKHCEIDAFCARDPYVRETAEQLGERAVILHAAGLPANTINLVAMDGLVQERPGLLRRFVAGLIQLEEAGRMPNTSTYGRLENYITLDQNLLYQLESLARWAMGVGMTRERPMPNFFHRIQPMILSDLAAERVSLIH